VPIDAAPLAVNGTLKASAAVHQASDLESQLNQVDQAVPGPYNARAVGQIEDLEVLLDQAVPGGKLLNADLIRAEAVAVCSAGAVKYSAASEVVDLQIGGQDPLSGPLNDLVGQISDAINASPLVDLVDVDTDVVTVTATGATVDALVVTVLAAAGADPLVQLRLGHAEVSGLACGGAAVTQCSDKVDNDGDAVIDAADPGCHSDGDAGNASSYVPGDDSEADGAAAAQCSDKLDNDGDGVVDAADPGCHSDGDAGNAGSYVASDTTEADQVDVGAGGISRTPGGAALPRTGGQLAGGLAAAAGTAGLALFALRRRILA
jgi:hypothetical protein